jgi:acyl carrier protein
MVDTLRELQAMVTAYCGISGMEIDPDCSLRHFGVDAVGREELIVALEDKYKIVVSMVLDENDNKGTSARSVKDQTLREFAAWVDELFLDGPAP